MTADQNSAEVRARIEAVEKRITAESWDAANTISSLVSERLDQAEGTLKRLHEEGALTLNSASRQLLALEPALQAHLERTEEATRNHEREIGEMYEALVKLGTNQQTLAGNLSSWRQESGGDLGVINNRLEQMDRALQATLGRLDGEVQALRQAIVAGREGSWRGRFKEWLYGTRRVFAGSWREEAQALREKLRLKTRLWSGKKP